MADKAIDKPMYRIFISSTYKDLKEERRKLFYDILKADHIPSGMEAFSAGNQQDFEVIKEAIDKSHIYVVLVGHRYGNLAKDGKSFTQIEYEYAQENTKPTLAYLLDDEEAKEARNKLEGSDKESSDERAHDVAYWAFRKQVRGTEDKRRIVDFFGKQSGAPSLSNDLQKLIDKGQIGSPGLVSADSDQRLLGAR